MKKINNFFINKKKIAIELESASFINIPGYGQHIGFWISKKFIYPSKHHINQVAIGIIEDNDYQIVKYLKNENGNNVRNNWRILTGKELILLYEKEKQLINKQFGRSIKIPTKEEEQKLKEAKGKLVIGLKEKQISDDGFLWD